jgi:prolyl-tRNA editing enzyme YbaK/EbsC (Cys-tRNA(Pro) deacylase)
MSLVTDHLAARGVPFETIHHTQAYTSIDEARALGMAADEVVKTVLVDTPSGHALVVIPGSRRVEMRLVRRAVRDNHARLATEEEIEKGFPGYELGALPPLASLLRVPTYVDPEVRDHETVVFAAGTQTESVKIRTEDLIRDEPVTVVPLTRGSALLDEEPIT